MDDCSGGENHGTGGQSAETGGYQQPAPGAHRDHDKDDFEPLEQYCLERGYAGRPAEVSLAPTRFFTQLGSFGPKMASSSCNGMTPAGPS